MSEQTQEALLRRLEVLEAQQAIRACMNQYMLLCDHLGVDSNLHELMALFSENAIWQGKGKRYSKTFGRYQGRDAIANMFATYTKAPAHFELNAHFLCNELINVAVDNQNAKGSWMLIQPSSFSSGKSQLSCARINVEFLCHKEQWLINVFTTENIFSRPMSDPWDNVAALDVPKQST